MTEMPYRTPTHFGGKRIKFRVPYSMPGELIVPAATAGLEYPEATFLHTIELPFEIWDMKVGASQLDGGNVPEASTVPSIYKFFRMRLQDVSKNQLMTRNAQLASTLVEVDASDESGIWYWRIPYTLVRAEGFQISIDNLLASNSLRAEITFRGYLLVLAPPSETR